VFYRLVEKPLDEAELERISSFLRSESSGPTIKAKD
jgi:hypothetical protein